MKRVYSVFTHSLTVSSSNSTFSSKPSGNYATNLDVRSRTKMLTLEASQD